MWELDHKESWALNNWCFWIVVLEKTLESALDYKEIQPVHPKGNQSWVFIGRTDAEAESPIIWPSEVKNWLLGKDLDAGKDWRQEETGLTEDEMVGCHHWLDGHEFEQALRVGDEQGSLVCCSPWVAKSRTRLNNWTEQSEAQILQPAGKTHRDWLLPHCLVCPPAFSLPQEHMLLYSWMLAVPQTTSPGFPAPVPRNLSLLVHACKPDQPSGSL